MTIKVCTTGNTDFTGYSVRNHSPGCSCFASAGLTPCRVCHDFAYPRYYRVTLSGFNTGTCDRCNEWNATYILENPATNFGLSGRCFVGWSLPCNDSGLNLSAGIQFIRGYDYSILLNSWGTETDFWNIGDLIDTGTNYLQVTISNHCNRYPAGYDAAGLPKCGLGECIKPGGGFQGLLYLLDVGQNVDCLKFGPVNVPFLKKTGNGDFTSCSHQWEKCTVGTVEVSSL